MKLFIAMMASLGALVAISIDAMLPALKDIGRDLGVADLNHVQSVIIVIFAGLGVGQLVFGPLSDMIGRKKVLYGGLALYAVGSVECLLAGSLGTLLFGRLVQGIGVSASQVCVMAIIRDKFEGAQMARILSFVMTVLMIVPALAPTIGQGILLFFSWRSIFALYLFLAGVMGLWVFFGLEETLSPEKRLPFRAADIKAGFREVFAHRITRNYMICTGLIFGGLIGYLGSSRQIFQDLFGVGAMFGVYFGGLALVLAAAALVNARIVAKVGMRRLCRQAVAASVGFSALFMGYCHFFGEGLWPFVIFMAALYCTMGLTFGNISAIAMEPMGHIAGIASAVIGAASSIIAFLLGTLIGQAYDGTLMPVIAGFLFLNGLSWWLLHAAHRGESGDPHNA